MANIVSYIYIYHVEFFLITRVIFSFFSGMKYVDSCKI